MKRLVIIVITIYALLGLVFGFIYLKNKSIVTTKRQIVYDTIRYYHPILVDSVVVRYVTKKLPICNSDTTDLSIVDDNTDSAYVQIPITQKVYKDSTYQAWVSGYMPNLDSINIRVPIIRQTITKQLKNKWGIGAQIGVGVTNSKIEPYIGIGISYNIFSW